MHRYTTSDIREEFKRMLAEREFTSVNREGSMTDLVGGTTIEIIDASFIADEDSIFGEVNWDWVAREHAWYESMSLNVNDIPGGPPKIWAAVADKDGFINSNYGWCIGSWHNGFREPPGLNMTNSQYKCVVSELQKNPESRRAEMIYTRPEMWLDYNKNGRQDFCCTDTVQYLIRKGEVHALVRMRSNDSLNGYKGDRAWQHFVLNKVAADVGIPAGKIYWNVGSMHIYARHYYLVHHFSKTGEIAISKENYNNLYPDSSFI